MHRLIIKSERKWQRHGLRYKRIYLYRSRVCYQHKGWNVLRWESDLLNYTDALKHGLDKLNYYQIQNGET